MQTINSIGLILLVSLQCILAQEVSSDTSDQNVQNQRISFSTIPFGKEKSLQPYYNSLKDATYGVQRFSIFEQIAAYHIEKGNTDSIMYYGNLYTDELKNWDKPEHSKKLYYAKAYYLLGMGSKLNGLLDNAIKWHIKGITDAELAKDEEYQFKNKIKLAKIYNLKGEYQKAIPILEKSIEGFENELPRHTNEALVSIGDAYFGLKEYSRARPYYESALVGTKKFNEEELELLIGLKLGSLSENEGKYDDALKRYDETKEQALQKGFNVLYFEGTILIGNLFYKEKNYEAASIALSVAYVNAVGRENLYYQKKILDLQRRAFAAMEDYKNAYAVMTQLDRATSRIHSQQQQRINKEMEVQYETLQKEKEILVLQEDQIKQEVALDRQRTVKNAFLIGFLVILIPIIALLYVYYQKIQTQSELSKKQEEIGRQKVTALMQEQELNLIKASIEGQDEERKRIAQELHESIGGNLAGIKLQLSSMDKGSEQLKTVTRQLDETYQLVRDISHTLIPKRFKQNAFAELIVEYTKSIRDSGKLEIGFHPHPKDAINKIDKKIQIELFKIIQELITNTVKHAEAKKVDIQLGTIDENITLLYEDNGKGFETSKTVDGIGFKNIKDRVNKLSGTLQIDSVLQKGTVIAIEIPMEIQKNDEDEV